MKNIKDLIIESNVYDRGLTQAMQNILNNHSDDADTIIYDLLNNITDNGNDDLVISYVTYELKQILKKINVDV